MGRSLVVPALDERASVPAASRLLVDCLRAGIVDEAFVIDGGSTDGTPELLRERGVRVEVAADLPPGPPVWGKGDSLLRAAEVATGDTLVFVDADVRGLGPADVDRLAGAVEVPGTVLAKGAFDRLDAVGGTPRQLNGRVTALAAKPLLDLLVPDLAHVSQPLSGQQAVRRAALRDLDVLTGYAFEVSLLLEVAAAFGTGAIVEVPLAPLTHRSRDDAALTAVAQEVVAAILWSLGIESADGARVELPPAVGVRRTGAPG